MNMPRPSMLWIYGLIGAFIIGWYVFGDVNDTPLPSDWTTVREMVEKGDVEKIQVVNRDQAQVFLKKEAAEQYRRDTVDKRFKRLPETGVQLTFTIGSVDSFREDLKNAEQQSGQTVPVVYENKANDWTNVLINLLPWVLIIGVWIFIMRSMSRGAGGGAGGGIMNVGKAKAQVFDKDASKRVTFKDVAGLEEAKVEIMEIVDFLKKSEKYKELGAKIPKGALLVGPPGTGKTLLAKAVAKPTCRSFRFRVPISWRCSWAWAHRVSATCSSRPSRRPPASSSSTRSTPLAAPAARTPDFRATTNAKIR